MMELVNGSRQSGIHSLSSLKFDPVKTADVVDRSYTSTAKMTALVSPSGMFSGPPPPYSYPPANGTPSHPLSGLVSPPESRRTSDDREPPIPAQQRQSLPSIQEALGGPKPAPFQISGPQSATLPPSHSFSQGPPPVPRSHPSDASPYSAHVRHPQAPHNTPPQSSYSLSRPYPREEPPPLTLQPNFNDPSRRPPIPSYSGPPSNGYSGPPGQERPRYEHEHRMSAPSVGSGSSYTEPPPRPAPYNHQPPQSTPQTNYTPAPYPSHRPYQGRFGVDHAEEHTKFGEPASMRKTYAPVLKRHLNDFDLEVSLAEISSSSNILIDFSSYYHRIAQESQRSATGPERMPTIEECENMLAHQNKIAFALQRIRDSVYEQQHVLADQQAREHSGKSIGDYDMDDGSIYGDDLKNQGYGGSDAKKRSRGRAAPPGRCHSCNRAETPEWRRGPDGARTLCNACGLHYAKLTRKMGSKQNLGTSSLRPKSPR